MEIPVTGFIVHSDNDGSDSLHTHSLFITTWDGAPVHVHEFAGVTSFDVGHDHRYAGVTEPAPSGVQHVHGYYTVTSFDHQHKHVIRGVTGPAIPVPGGGHIHYFEGFTTVDGLPPHTHRYEGRTSV
jgi:hypothetical protein